MASKLELISQIRFGLEQLSSRNGHHDFEHLCRAYARKRVCANLLPATGPVSAGGDQGRDFETFRSYLSKSDTLDSAFGGRVSDGPVAFACTLQKSSLEGKVKADVKAILGGGVELVGITYFCSADLPVAKRHKLQKWAASEGVELEIHDGAALAENLAEPDCYWIASEYLSIPSELFPTPKELQEEDYQKLKERWTEPMPTGLGYPEFHELKSMVRSCTGDSPGQQDLPFWMDRMRLLISEETPEDLAQCARYEVAVAQLRGLGSLTGHESIVQGFFSHLDPRASLQLLEDAVVLLSYCMTATALGQAEFNYQDLDRWQQTLIDFVDDELETNEYDSTRAVLYQCRAMLSIHFATEEGVRCDIAAQMEWWLKLIDVLDGAVLFPVESFADRLTLVCHLVGDDPDYDKLTAKVDSVLSTRRGGFAAAEKCCQRALAHHDQGRVLRAISEVQKARINWFAEETIALSLKTMLLLSEWYTELGLVVAAKYYGLAAAYIAMGQDDFEVKQISWMALAQAANCDYCLGAFAGFLDTAHTAIEAHHQLADNPGDVDCHPSLFHLLMHTVMAVLMSERVEPERSAFLEEQASLLGIGELLDETLATERQQLGGWSDAKLIEKIESELRGMPISDLGYRRVLSWRALGVEWVLEWENNFDETVTAEQYAAGLQIIQALLRGKTLCLPKTRVHIVIQRGSIDKPSVEPSDTEIGFKWQVTWPSQATQQDANFIFNSIVYTSIHILAGTSFLPVSDALSLISDLMQDGLPTNAIIGQPYEVVYKDIIVKDSFDAARAVVVAVDDELNVPKSREHEQLRGYDGPGPGYSEEKTREMIEGRYSGVPEKLPYTIAQLSQSEEFLAVVADLRGDGWKDWHLLLALVNAVVNYRFQEKYGPHGTPELMREHLQDFFENGESEGDATLPATLLTREMMDQERTNGTMPILTAWGFQIHHPAFTPDIVEQFLADHYGYWSDDVPHATIFGPPEA